MESGEKKMEYHKWKRVCQSDNKLGFKHQENHYKSDHFESGSYAGGETVDGVRASMPIQLYKVSVSVLRAVASASCVVSNTWLLTFDL